jgi:hypothetical protein
MWRSRAPRRIPQVRFERAQLIFGRPQGACMFPIILRVSVCFLSSPDHVIGRILCMYDIVPHSRRLVRAHSICLKHDIS